MLATRALELQDQTRAFALLLLRAIVGAFREVADLAGRQVAVAGALRTRQRVADLIEIVPVPRREVAVRDNRERILHGDARNSGLERQPLAADHMHPSAADLLKRHLVRVADDDLRHRLPPARYDAPSYRAAVWLRGIVLRQSRHANAKIGREDAYSHAGTLEGAARRASPRRHRRFSQCLGVSPSC